MKKLFLIKRTERGEKEGWQSADCLNAIVVRADNEAEAQDIAVEHCFGEPENYWTDPAFASCEELSPEGETGAICVDFWES